jgi:PEP-CTERM motif
MMKALRSVSLAVAFVASLAASSAHAGLYTASFGTALANSSNCDDCFDGPVGLGAGQTIAFFGGSYSNLFVGSNGYVTFGAGATTFSPTPLDTQTVGKMIAGLFTDLDSRSDAASNVYYNDSSLGQLVITWSQMGHFSLDYSVRSTFQLVIRSDQYAVAPGEGQIGFFYDSVTDGATASAGFGDGLAAVNTGEVAFARQVGARTLSNNAPRWYNLNGGTPTPTDVPEPSALALVGLALAGLTFASRKKRAA